jgi:tetratricopeptide (TPR) repeat protein/Cdc6-like AAA superfamily ATPase
VSSTDSNPRTTFVSDEPSPTDHLDFGSYAGALADLIGAPETSTPITMGIFGTWGSGKTTLMQLIQQELDRKPDVKTMWINVWKLGSQEEMWRAFIQTLLTQAHRQLPFEDRLRFDWDLLCQRIDQGALIRQLVANSYRVLIVAAPLLLTKLWPNSSSETVQWTGGGASFLLGVWLLFKPIIEAAREKVSIDLDAVIKNAPYEAQVSALQRLQSEFESLVKTWVGEQGRVVVFIDDLDRCAPDKVPEMLEALKLFATTRRCVYVLGIDQAVVAASIEARYKDINKSLAGEAAIDGFRYLEKIIQLPFLLPLIEVNDIRSYVDSFQAAWPHPGCPDVFALGLPPNPRQIKRAVNVFFLLWQLAERRRQKIGGAVTPLRLAKVVALQTAHSEAFEELKDQPQLLKDWEAFCLKPPSDQKPEELDPLLRELVKHPEIRRLFGLHKDDPLASFTRLEQDDLATFFSLARRVPVTEAEAAAKAKPSEARAAADNLHQLLPPPRDLTGRAAELERLAQAVEQGASAVSLQGPAGIGKTALALQLAERLTPRYPDAQFYLDLKGTSATPLPAAEAMAHIACAYQPTARLPEDEVELRQLYQSALSNKRALVFAENARDASQVEPLVPPPGCFLIITSRAAISLPGVLPVSLGTLAPQDARELLLKIAPRIGEQADEIARLCGYNPLALRLAGSTLAERIDLSPEEYVQRLREKPAQAGDALLSVIYDMLGSEKQRMWCVLNVFSGAFDVAAAAAVWGTDADSARNALNELVKYRLVDLTPLLSAGGEGRYRLHEMHRAFAEAHLGAPGRDLAQQRHAAHYKSMAANANRLYLEGGDALRQGLDLFDREWGNIREGQGWTAAHAESDDVAARLCSDYPDAAANLLDLRQKASDRLLWRQAALAAARRLKDRAAEALHLGNLGNAYADLGDPRRAIEFYEQQLVITREIGDRRGEGIALGNLGSAYADLGETARAIQVYERALTIDREIGDRRGEGTDLSNLGLAHMASGDPRRAIECHEQALAIARELGDRLGEGNALGNLGLAYAESGETDRALELYQQQLAITREIGDRRGEGIVLKSMSLARYKLGDHTQAIADAEAALKILEQAQDPIADAVLKQLAEWKEHKPAIAIEKPPALAPRVLAIVYDPVVNRSTGEKLTQRAGWNSADDLIAGYIADVDECSGGLVKYRVVERVDVDEFPQKVDGFRYDADAFLAVLNQSAHAHDPDQANYHKIASDHHLIERVTKGDFDEVWLFGFPYGGLYESRMAGHDAFWCNAPPLEDTDKCPRRFVIMGFSYQRGVGEMLESFGHRAESILEQVFSRAPGEANLWERFRRYDLLAPGQAEVGTLHFAPNSQLDYDWGNPRMVPSRCDDWLHFPNMPNKVRQVNCAEWGDGDIRLHHKWWLKHLPRATGRTHNVDNNWWTYIIDPNNV